MLRLSQDSLDEFSLRNSSCLSTESSSNQELTSQQSVFEQKQQKHKQNIFLEAFEDLEEKFEKQFNLYNDKDLESRIFGWLDSQGVIQSDPQDLQYDYFQKAKQQIFSQRKIEIEEQQEEQEKINSAEKTKKKKFTFQLQRMKSSIQNN